MIKKRRNDTSIVTPPGTVRGVGLLATGATLAVAAPAGTALLLGVEAVATRLGLRSYLPRELLRICDHSGITSFRVDLELRLRYSENITF